MSTFDGIVEEFPDIRIDYFRNHPNRRQPAVCFLSHVHSDHLLGLETLKMPFVYCSATTRRLLLKMEKYPHRINFSKGILEARKQTYKHLKSILRALPLHTPTELELRPNHFLQVTLFDANHCPGAVMFLIEGQGRAILYTGDVRAESWWVNSIIRNPILLPYASGQKHLDCMYLDTTFASHQNIFREFPTKAEGLTELLQKLSKCPTDSIFYFRAWTLGYEDVWIAMSNFLKSRVHVDQYQFRLFRSIIEDGLATEPGPALTGFQVGNAEQPGCLTTESDVKIHSCEPGMPCHSAISKDRNIVWITPIISRLPDGTEVSEIGAGGGKGDLYQSREIDVGNDFVLEAMEMLISTLTNEQDVADKIRNVIQRARKHQDHRIVLEDLGANPNTEITVKDFMKLMTNSHDKSQQPIQTPQKPKRQRSSTIHFPYSRHSSYSELRILAQAFQPKDICPCTVDIESWTESLSIEALFGDLCSGSEFRYDKVVREEVQRRHRDSVTTIEGAVSQQQDTQTTASPSSTQVSDDLDRVLREPENLGTTQKGSDPISQVVTDVEDGTRTFRDQWLDGDGDSEMYPKKQTVSEPTEFKDIPNPIVSRRLSMTSEQLLTSTEDLSELVGGLEDLPDSLGTIFWSSRTSIISSNETVSDPRDLRSLKSPMWSTESNEIDMDRRTKAYAAARACIEEGDTKLWSALNIRSLSSPSHEVSSPEL